MVAQRDERGRDDDRPGERDRPREGGDRGGGALLPGLRIVGHDPVVRPAVPGWNGLDAFLAGRLRLLTAPV